MVDWRKARAVEGGYLAGKVEGPPRVEAVDRCLGIEKAVSVKLDRVYEKFSMKWSSKTLFGLRSLSANIGDEQRVASREVRMDSIRVKTWSPERS